MSNKEWKTWDHESCPECGGAIAVETSAPAGSCHDGDSATCLDCGKEFVVAVDEVGNKYPAE